MMSTKPLVLVVGATGRTAQSILEAFLNAGTFVSSFIWTDIRINHD